MLKTVKRKLNSSNKGRTMRRKVGGHQTKNTKLAVIVFVRNIVSQILNNVENTNDSSLKNTKYYKLSDEKKNLYAAMYNHVGIGFDKFKERSGVMMNQRNKSIHPLPDDMISNALICRQLIEEHGLGEEMNFESKIIQYFIFVSTNKRVTRSMTRITEEPSLRKGEEPSMRKREDTWARGLIK